MPTAPGLADTPTPSATVLMLRDGPAGLEVFLLKRHSALAVLGGVHVFPGGKLDAEDADLAPRLDRPAPALREALGEPDLPESQAPALFVAAIREAFEEAGVLFADWGQTQLDEALAQHQAGLSFAHIVERSGALLRASALAPWSRWITPRESLNMRRRFDARFFVAAVPPGQAPTHDRSETTDSVWLAPAQALRDYWERRIDLAGPQLMSLVQLARHRDVASVFGEARGRRPPCIRPESFRDADGGGMVCYPGDPRHSAAEPLMHGPSRLLWVGGRYEPEAGLAGFLG